MARLPKNSLFKGLTGQAGGMVFRQVAGETIVSKRPGKGKKKKKRTTASPKEQERAARFERAIAYGRRVQRDPALRAIYAAGMTVGRKVSPYHVAVSDYMRSPVVEALDLTGYRGQAGDLIRVRATDNFAVVAVRVRLLGVAGEVLEQGPAQAQAGDWWHYRAQTTPPAGVAGLIWEAEAEDQAGNITSRQAATA